MTSRAAQHFARRRLAGDKAITVWLTPAERAALEALKARTGLSGQGAVTFAVAEVMRAYAMDAERQNRPPLGVRRWDESSGNYVYDYDALAEDVKARFPNILARLAE